MYSESSKYLNEFKRCSSSFPQEVMRKCMNIGKGLVWKADAVGQLQQMSITLNTRYSSDFINFYENLNSKDQDNLIRFYADKENHNAYKIYQDLIDKLNTVGQRDISEKLETARKNRILQKNH